VEIKGSFDPAFQSIVDCFEKQYEIGLDQGSSLAMTCEGETVVDIWAGHRDVAKTKPWEEDTIVNVFSSTKNATSLCAFVLAGRGQLDFFARWQSTGQNLLRAVKKRFSSAM